MTRRVVISGSSGLIGSALIENLSADGIEVTRLVRRPARRGDERRWDPGREPLGPDVLAGADAVVNLNGASIGHVPWTARYRSTLLWSRLTPTRALAAAMAALGDDAPAFISASAVGYYGSAPGRQLTESDPPGAEFLAGLCVEWEHAALRAGARVRTVLARSAPVVHPRGVLAPLITLTRLGTGGPIGRGTQSWPWISLDDEVRALRHAIDKPLSGPVNLVGPTRATANDLGFAVALRMNRPYLMRAPAWALRIVLGQAMTDSLLTSDAHVVPAALQASGFTFTHERVEDAVAAVVPAAG